MRMLQWNGLRKGAQKTPLLTDLGERQWTSFWSIRQIWVVRRSRIDSERWPLRAYIFCIFSGAVKSDLKLAPKDNLCGDLNRGYVPLNPLMQNIDGHPYPLWVDFGPLAGSNSLLFAANSSRTKPSTSSPDLYHFWSRTSTTFLR